MKLSYNYFLERRGVSTQKIIDSNHITTYEQFVELLDALRVIPPTEEEMNSFFIDEKLKVAAGTANNKVEKKDDKKVTRIPTKKTRTRKAPARDAGGKNGKPEHAVQRTSSVRKKKSDK